MPSYTNKTANHNMPKDGHITRLKTAVQKPSFVVSSIYTRRSTVTVVKEPRVRRLPPTLPATVAKERPSVPHPLMKRLPQLGFPPNVVPKAEPRCFLHKPILEPALKMTKMEVSPHSPVVLPEGRSLPEKTRVSKALKAVHKLKEGKVMGRRPVPVPVTRRSTQDTAAIELPPRPSCIPSTRMYRSSANVSEAHKVKQEITACPQLSVHTSAINSGMVKNAVRVRATDICPKKSADVCHTEVPSGGWATRSTKHIMYCQAVGPKPVGWSPPPSPDLSSFPSQTWMIVTGEVVSRIETSTVVRADETLSNIDDTLKSSLSSPSTDHTLTSPEESIVGLFNTIKLNSLTQLASAKVSDTVCAATIISPSENGTASMETLAKVMQEDQVSSPVRITGMENGTLVAVRCIIEITRSLFSPPRSASESGPKIIGAKIMGDNVSQIRKLFTPLENGVKVSKDPKMQMEIEILKAQKKVVDPS